VLATARAQRWEPAEVLRTLLGEELAGRERSSLATRRAAATFPTGKTFEAWEPTASSIPAPTQSALRTLEWVRRRENLVVCGPSGTGKTFFLEALGQLCVEAGLKVAWFALEDLGVLVRRHRADDTVTKAVARILRSELIAVDDIGLLPVSPDAAEGLYRLVDAAYEKRSIAISSNLHPAGFDELMPKTLAGATVDRLLHHAHVCVTTGDSVRLQQATSGKGVTPLTWAPNPSPSRSTPDRPAPAGGHPTKPGWSDSAGLTAASSSPSASAEQPPNTSPTTSPRSSTRSPPPRKR
jgi:DNA replication protein DnaC